MNVVYVLFTCCKNIIEIARSIFFKGSENKLFYRLFHRAECPFEGGFFYRAKETLDFCLISVIFREYQNP